MYVLTVFVVFQCICEAHLQSCIYTMTDFVCKEIPEDYPVGVTSMIFFTGGLREISLSKFNSTELTSVSSLTMTNQGVTTIRTQTFVRFENLKTFNLDNNNISQVSSDWFNHQVPLETLRLSNNRITALDQNSFNGLSNLVLLNLSRNQIHTITTSSFLTLRKLGQLDLSNNRLTSLSANVLFPLNSTKIHIYGNPWDCSCSVNDFAEFLRGLKNASLLEHEMLVRCNSPPELKDVPVWQVQECKTTTTITTTLNLFTWNVTAPSLITVSITTGTPATRSPATVIITEPLLVRHSTIVILIVVLCALVLVICVLSVLYHRKRERKHLQMVKPCTEKPEVKRVGNTAPGSGKEENSQACISTAEILQRTGRIIAGDENMSQIYQIYSSGMMENRDSIKRVRSAGPVLCRGDLFAKLNETEAPTEQIDDDYYSGRITTEPHLDVERVDSELEMLEAVIKSTAEEMAQDNPDVNPLESCEKSFVEPLDGDDENKPGKSRDQDILQGALETQVSESDRSEPVLQTKYAKTPEYLPYITIGPDQESQSPVLDLLNTAEHSTGPARPIRRVLTWPPTAVQWKKHWAQNQILLKVFPKVIFVTGCSYEIRPFHHGTFPVEPQFNAVEFLPESSAPGEDVRVIIDDDSYRAGLESCTQSIRPFSVKECFPITDVAPGEDGKVTTNEETWSSEFESAVNLSSKNSPDEESQDCAEFRIFDSSFGALGTKPATGENEKDNLKGRRGVKKKTQQVRQVMSAMQKRSRRAKTTPRAHSEHQQSIGSHSRAPPSGGSPKDDSLLLGNEYTFIDLLHEVVENHGRWTRDRWRQTQKSKHKPKPGQSC